MTRLMGAQSQDQGVAGSSLTIVNALCPWARHINPCLVLVQPRKDPAIQILLNTVKPVQNNHSKNTKNWVSRPISLNAGQKYCRMLQGGEHSAILLTFIIATICHLDLCFIYFWVAVFDRFYCSLVLDTFIWSSSVDPNELQNVAFHQYLMGAHWLSGRVLDRRPWGCRFEHHRRHRVVSLSKTSLLSTGSTQERPVRTSKKNCWLGGKESNQTNKQIQCLCSSLANLSSAMAAILKFFKACWIEAASLIRQHGVSESSQFPISIFVTECVPERFFFIKVDFEKKNSRQLQKHEKLPSMQRVTTEQKRILQ